MNNLLELKGEFTYKPMGRVIPHKNIPKTEKIAISHISDLILQLDNVKKNWTGRDTLDGILVSVKYICIVPKSRRIAQIFKKNKEPNYYIRGARFDSSFTKHIFTYYVSEEMLEETIFALSALREECLSKFGDSITYEDINRIDSREIVFSLFSKSIVINLLYDCYNVECFSLEYPMLDLPEDGVITLYKTEKSNYQILQKIGVKDLQRKMIDEVTFKLTSEDIKNLYSKAGYLISMGVTDFTKLDLMDVATKTSSEIMSIPEPSNEPVIGVIDTLFNTDVYFSRWVEYHKMISDEIPVSTIDEEHGTSVDSLIVDGPSINPDLDDNCGRFKVRHFGVCTSRGFSLTEFLKKVEMIVKENIDIRVWNISLGSNLEISKNFISPAGYLLDKLQNEYNILFVIAGTNKPNNLINNMLIGAPADSLNSIVVNSVSRSNERAIYSRKGPVLSFFNKPDVSYYGGDTNDYIRVCKPLGEGFVMGTSFAAPWISRKVAFMIYKLGLSREITKALLVDSASGWDNKASIDDFLGYGIVPVKIEDVIGSKNDEIKFYLVGRTENYETFTYNIPAPIVNDKFPFKAKATLCYFPKCDRNQGVDYTGTEMDIHFGRVTGNPKRPLAAINNNKQDDIDISSQDFKNLSEEKARELYRKWDNIKHISEPISSKRSVNKYQGLWGLSVKTKERVANNDRDKLMFGVVITFKEVNGINRISEFIKLCQLKRWLVKEIVF